MRSVGQQIRNAEDLAAIRFVGLLRKTIPLWRDDVPMTGERGRLRSSHVSLTNDASAVFAGRVEVGALVVRLE